MAVDDETKDFIKAVRVEHDRRIDDVYAKKSELNSVAVSLPTAAESIKGGIMIGKGFNMTDDSLNVSYRIDDKVTLTGGVDIRDNVQLNQNVSLFAHTGNYWKFTASTIDSGSTNLHYTGKHVFDDRISIKGGFYTAESINVDFGSDNSIDARNDTINIGNSTIAGSAVIKGNQKFNDKITLQGGAIIQDDVVMGDYLKIDLGRHNAIKAGADTITFSGTIIEGNPTITGNVYYEGNQHFHDDVSFNDTPKFYKGAYFASYDNEVEENGSITANHNIIAVKFSSIDGYGSDLDLRDCTINLEGATITGYQGSELGSYLDLTNRTIDLEGATITGYQSAEFNLSGCTIDLEGATITGLQSGGIVLDTIPSTVEGAMWYVP